jgi:hypothetical protein
MGRLSVRLPAGCRDCRPVGAQDAGVAYQGFTSFSPLASFFRSFGPEDEAVMGRWGGVLWRWFAERAKVLRGEWAQ